MDHICKASGIKVMKLDLCSKEGRSLLKGLLENPDVFWVHWAPPCGTFSRAREIKRRGAPKPLRNMQFVKGFPVLRSMADRVRVRSANALVELMTQWCKKLSARGVCWSIENPSNSLLWAYPGLHDMVLQAHVVHLHACMFGSARKKATALVSNRSWFRRSGIECSGDHPHASWGKTKAKGRTVWATSTESAYTPELSHAWASCAATALLPDLEAAPASKKRSRKSLCEPNFDNVITVFAEEASPFMNMFPPCRVPRKYSKWPKGSKLLALDESGHSATLAVPCEPSKWCQRAKQLEHPRTIFRPLGKALETSLETELLQDSAKAGRFRAEACKEITRMCQDCASAEAEARLALDPRIERVTGTKKSVAMRRLLLQVGHVDPDVADLVREGFPLVGWLPRSGLWDADCEPPSLSVAVEALTASAEDISSRSVKGVCRHRDAELEPAIWAATVEESSKGWLTFSQDVSVPESHVVSSRFGVKQKNKIRPIDNFKSSCVNAACGVQEKVAMDGIDEIVSLCLHWLRRRKPLSAEDRILGRTWDLKSAYKQLAVKREHKRFALICVVDPESNRVRIAEIHSMPFGAVAAVHAFLRCGEGIKAIGRGKLHLVMTNFFDDFTVLASRANCKHVQLVVSFLFRKLGWDVAPEEKKNAPFAEVFDVLGVHVDLSKQQEGKVSIKNTPDRLAELQADVSRILENGSISYEESQRLRGRFLFAEQNVWGRNSRQAI